jgi:sulfur carrier protein
VRIKVNGDERDVPAATTVAALLDMLAVPRQAMAVEVNGVLVPRSLQPTRELAEGDAVEIVTLVGGG